MSPVKGVALETLFLAALGLIFAVAANALSPRGLRLSQNYFPEPKRLSGTASSPPTASATDPLGASAERLKLRGLQFVTHEEAVRLFHDPHTAQGLVVFVDARDEDHYAAGHIPGAWLLNRYRAEDYLVKVLPVCLTALKVVVYCTSGDCEDSEYAAILLRDAGVPRENLFIYADGINAWTAKKLPLETGVRGSGEVPPAQR